MNQKRAFQKAAGQPSASSRPKNVRRWTVPGGSACCAIGAVSGPYGTMSMSPCIVA